LDVKVVVAIWSVPPTPAAVGLVPSTQIAPPKPPPFDELPLKRDPLMMIVLERPWSAPPELLWETLPAKEQFVTVTIPTG